MCFTLKVHQRSLTGKTTKEQMIDDHPWTNCFDKRCAETQLRETADVNQVNVFWAENVEGWAEQVTSFFSSIFI